MIEGIKEIGDIIISEAPEKFLESLALNVPSEKQRRKQYIVIIEFDTARGTINFDYEEIKEETPRKYLWVGNAKSNNPQDRFTTTNLDYLVSQTVPNFRLLTPGGKLGELFERIRDKFYYDLGFQEGQQERYRYVWDIKKLRISSRNIKEFWEEASNNPRKMIGLVSNEIYKYLKRERGLKKNEIALFTLKINGQLMVNIPEYRNYLETSLIDELFSDKTTGVCYLCQKKKEITQDMTRFSFKYYITDKIGFSSGLQKDGFFKNFSLCRECYKRLLVGESFVKNNLASFLAGTNLYVIPKFIFLTAFSVNKLEKWAEYINISFNSTISLRGLRKLQESLEDYIEFEERKNNFILNLLFYRKTQSEFRILRLIKDIPPSRLDNLRTKEIEVHDIGVRLLGEDDRWYLNLEGMYYLLPVHITGNKRVGKEALDYKKVLEFYDALFSAKPISYKFLIEQFTELACVYRFEKFDNYNIKSENPETDIIYAILRANLLLLYLRKLYLLERGEAMNVEGLDLRPPMKEYIKEMGYSEHQTALFLLGYLIGEIGNAQWKRESPTKPILEKITYQGMTVEKLKRLTNEVFEKLKQYKSEGKPLLTFNEPIFAECKRLLDRNINDWRPSDQENVFYVLSGYAYATQERMKKKEGNNKIEQDKR